jgi:hypothetical protein
MERENEIFMIASNLYDAAEMVIAMQSMRGMEHALVRRSGSA